MLKQVYNHLRGSVQIDLKGAAIERFLNLCAIHDIGFWDVQCLDAAHFTAWVSVGGYFVLRPYARSCGCSIRLVQKRGAPFLWSRLIRRAALWLGLLLCVAAVWFASARIWTIEVRGCQTTTPREILQILERVGIKTGARREAFQMKQLKNQVMLMTDKLSYFTVNFRGTHAIVEVWEKRNHQQKPQTQGPCSIVADKTGIVTALRVRTGIAQVKVGDTLQPGDLIASGVIVNEHDDTQVTLLHAQAEADVRTWVTLKTLVPAELQLAAEQPGLDKRHFLVLGNRRFPLPHIEKNGFSWYDKQISTRYLDLREDFRWPVGIAALSTRSCTAEEAAVDRQKLAQVLEPRMTAALGRQKPGATIVRTAFSLEKSKTGAWLGILKAELVETCGQEVPIG